jgi:hypothetical protein
MIYLSVEYTNVFFWVATLLGITLVALMPVLGFTLVYGSGKLSVFAEKFFTRKRYGILVGGVILFCMFISTQIIVYQAKNLDDSRFVFTFYDTSKRFLTDDFYDRPYSLELARVMGLDKTKTNNLVNSLLNDRILASDNLTFSNISEAGMEMVLSKRQQNKNK